MTAITYENLGGISGVVTNPPVAASTRSRDRNRYQRIAVLCNPDKPFTGTVYIQASVDDPTITNNALWFDVAEHVIDNEGGSWSYEFEGEFASLRSVCKAGDYLSAAHGTADATILDDGEFTVGGIAVSVTSGDTIALVADAINVAVVGDTTLSAAVTNGALRISKSDGTALVLENVTGTPLSDMGITAGTFTAGTITAIRMVR